LPRFQLRLCICSGASFSPDNTPCRVQPDPPSTERAIKVRLPVRIFRGYLVVVEGSIGSLHKLHFIIDTGADPTLVDRRVARAVGPSENPGRMALFNKTIEVQQVVLPSLEVGPIRIQNLRALARDLS